MRKIIMHVGVRKCGKSEYVEKSLFKYNKKLYIGTLPKLSKYELTILMHQQRRGNSFDLIEAGSDFEKDIIQIYDCINKYDICMIDSLSTWYFTLYRFLSTRVSLSTFQKRIVSLINNSDCDWYIVDIVPEIFIGHSNFHYSIVAEIQKYLESNLNINQIIDWRHERPECTLD